MEKDNSYKYDIFEKCAEFYILFYLVYGFFNTYTWACIKLDLISTSDEVKSFYNPVAGVYITLVLINIVVILACNWNNKRNRQIFSILNSESNILFYILCVPLFLTSVVYFLFQIACQIHACQIQYLKEALKDRMALNIVLIIVELLLFSGAMVLIFEQNRFIIKQEFRNSVRLNMFAIMLTIVGIAEYFVYHMTSQQVNNFIFVSSNYSNYSHFYNSSLYNKTKLYWNEETVRDFVQPLVILFTCSCLAYLVTIFYRHSSTGDTEDIVLDEQTLSTNDDTEPLHNHSLNRNTSYQTLEDETEPQTRHRQQQLELNPDQAGGGGRLPTFRLPPMSLVLGILFFTVTILLLTIIATYLGSSSKDIRDIGMLIIIYLPISTYLVSFVLLVMQLHEMRRWKRRLDSSSSGGGGGGIVDKTLIWVGAVGQLILVLSQLQLYRVCLSNSSQENVSISIGVGSILEYVLLLAQTLLQTVTLSIALDRVWVPPAHRGWHDYICPSVCMLSINVGLFVISLYSVYASSKNQFISCTRDQLFLKIFKNGFFALGETLAVLHRLHGTLIFGRMVVYTNQ